MGSYGGHRETMPITFPYRLDKTDIVRTVTKKGHLYPVGDDGDIVELFTTYVLAQALERTTRTIRAWETLGFPKPMYLVKTRPDPVGGIPSAPVRFYSADQILLCHLVYRQLGSKRGGDFPKLEFIRQVKLYFYKPELSVSLADGSVSFTG